MDDEEAKGREKYNNCSNYFTAKTLVQTGAKVGKNLSY